MTEFIFSHLFATDENKQILPTIRE